MQQNRIIQPDKSWNLKKKIFYFILFYSLQDHLKEILYSIYTRTCRASVRPGIDIKNSDHSDKTNVNI